ncbi:hypothetical protein F5141DRAFT_1061638 [Pisolithus sp. B1]|nr:hypothetical protein F5141DRAFT_1061638 [Pisolithus sp. B1]
MSHAKPSSDLPVKIGPPIGVQRSKRIKGNTTSPTKVQPGRNAKSHHQMIKVELQTVPHCNQDATTGDEADVDGEAGLQLHAGLISKDEIVEDGDCDEGENAHDKSVVPVPSMDESTSPNTDMDSETEE